MMGSFLTRALVMVLGYAYPAYECYKTVEMNRPEIEQLRFWCQYWILVALLTVFERVGDTFVSWLPMYSEAKLAFFVYLWYPKTRGTTYVYDTFFRPYVAKHETEIDRNILELKTRAGDIAVVYWQKVASYGQTRFFEILQYVAAQSQAPPPRPRPVQRQSSKQSRQAPPAASARQQSGTQQPEQSARPPPSPTKSQQGPTKSQQVQESTKASGPPQPAAPALQSQTSTGSSSASSETTSPVAPSEGEPMQVEVANAPANEDSVPPAEETPIEEAIRMTRGRLRKRAAISAPTSR